MPTEAIEGKGHIIGGADFVDFENEFSQLSQNEIDLICQNTRRAASETRRDVSMNRAVLYNSKHELALANEDIVNNDDVVENG